MRSTQLETLGRGSSCSLLVGELKPSPAILTGQYWRTRWRWWQCWQLRLFVCCNIALVDWFIGDDKIDNIGNDNINDDIIDDSGGGFQLSVATLGGS